MFDFHIDNNINVQLIAHYKIQSLKCSHVQITCDFFIAHFKHSANLNILKYTHECEEL